MLLPRLPSTYSGSSTGISYPIAIAIDPIGNVWVTNCQGPSIRGYGGSILTGLTKIVSGGSPILNIPQNSVYYCSPGLASDGLGNIYFAYGSGFAAHPQYVEK